jgi:hypothetical protein
MIANFRCSGMNIFWAAAVLSPRRSSALSLPLIVKLGDTARFVLIVKFENYLVNNKISATVV